MKKMHLLIISILIMAHYSIAGTPPAAVRKSFDLKFPGATGIRWGKENQKEWEAEFILNGNNLSANFSIDGNWVETEKKIPAAELPAAVADVIKKQFPGWNIIEADKTETAKNGLIYEADIKSGLHKKALVFKEDGSTIIE